MTAPRTALSLALLALVAACGNDPGDNTSVGSGDVGSVDTGSDDTISVEVDQSVAPDVDSIDASKTDDVATSLDAADCDTDCDGLAPAGDAEGDASADVTESGACTTSADCPQPATGCEANVCLAGTCTPQKLADGTPCDDGKPCTAKALCAAGTCQPSATIDCADGNACTTDACDPLTGTCTHTAAAAGTACDDGNACTSGTTCNEAGQCAGGANSCGCSSIKDCAAFDDGDPCNGTLYCNTETKGCEVLPSSVVICDPSGDGPCTQTVCAPSTGTCVSVPKDDATACDDGNACTKGEACSDGVCKATVNTCQCAIAADCLPYDDGNACNGTLFCDTSALPFTCKVNPASLVSCPKPASACQTAACDAKTGACSLGDAPDGTACDDGNDKTVGDACKAGACVPGTSIAQCKTDTDCAKFEDGDFCNGTLFCNAQTGLCQHNPATVVQCPTVDDTGCRKNLCQPKTGLCALTPVAEGLPCEDYNACTVGEVCKAGACTPSADLCQCQQDSDCAAKDDGNLCNGTLFCNKQKGTCELDPTTVVNCIKVGDSVCSKNTCVPKTGQCAMAAASDLLPCDDGDICTKDEVCIGGSCVGEKVCACQADADCANQEDGDLCNGTLYCNKLKGACELNPATIKLCPTAGDTTCSKNVCEPSTGSCKMQPAFNGAACDADGNPCTANDYCDGGACKAGKSVCGCYVDADCSGKQGEDKCVLDLYCDKASYTCKPTKVVQCDTSGDSACAKTTCDPKDGACKTKLQPEGTICGESAICAGAQVCDAKGACVPGEASDCDDADACTADACDPKKGCTFTAKDSGACDDGSVCTSGDSCKAGQCVGTAKDCSDDSPCTDDACDPEKGCVHLPSQATGCDDGDLCSVGDFCLQGLCLPGSKLLFCDDGNPCTGDSCDPKQGCVAKAIDGGKCDDGDGCTKLDACTGGSCKGVQLSCDDGSGCTVDSCDKDEGCQHAAQVGKACDDGNACTVGDACISSGLCASGQPKLCDDANPCTVDLCDPLQGCVTKQVVGSKCDDGNACTVNEKCENGACTGSPRDCDDGLVCSKDTCDKDAGCLYAVTAGSKCDDGNACTAGDTCAKSGACVPGPGLSCDDGNGCTTDACDPASGCTHKSLDGIGCDDGDACTQADKCTQGTCKGSGKSCDDGLACTSDGCDSAGGCTHTVQKDATCTDSDACTSGDSCLPSGYCKPGVPVDCDDGNGCTLDVCDASKGCSHELKVGAGCDDNDACTTGDVCSDKGVCGGKTLSCDDGKVCTTDTCDKLAGCKNAATPGKSCEDGSQCTIGDSCLASGVCASGPAPDCNDNIACTLDVCDPAKGCQHLVQDGAGCDDGSACTSGDVCSGSTCVGSPVSCDDGQSCTKDTCDKQKGCLHQALTGASCSDGNACTSGDTCSAAGTCAPGIGVNCDDGKPCTSDSCDGSAGCKHVAVNGISCSDGNACTSGDACTGGACVGQTVSCDDDNACTADTCDTKGGCLHSAKTGSGCNDGNACTSGDVCDSKGACIGKKLTCDDENACTLDACDVDEGCYATNLQGVVCDDGKVCTVGDSCANGVCGGAPKPCDDNNECTADVCDSQLGCTHEKINKPCNDGDECTTGDLCINGLCKGAAKNCDDGNACTVEECKKYIGCKYSFAATGAPCADGDACTVDACDGLGSCDSTALLGSRALPVGYEGRDLFVFNDGTIVVAGRSDSVASGAFLARIPWMGKQPPILFQPTQRSFDRVVPWPSAQGGYAGVFLLGRGGLSLSLNPAEPNGKAEVYYFAVGSNKIVPFSVPFESKLAGVPPVDHYSHGYALASQLLVGSARMGLEKGQNGVFLAWSSVPSGSSAIDFWHPTKLLGQDSVALCDVILTSTGQRYALVAYGDRVTTRLELLQWLGNANFQTRAVWSFGDDEDVASVAAMSHLVDRADGGFELVLPGKTGMSDRLHVMQYAASGQFLGAKMIGLASPLRHIKRRGPQYVMVDSNATFKVLRRSVGTQAQATRQLLSSPAAMAFGPDRGVYFLQQKQFSGLDYNTVERRDPWASALCSDCATKFAAGCGSECHPDNCDSATGACVGSPTAAYCDDGNSCTQESCNGGICKSDAVLASDQLICKVWTGACGASSGVCGNSGQCLGSKASTTCTTASGSCSEKYCVDGSGCKGIPQGIGTVCVADSKPGLQSYCTGDSSTSCQKPSAIEIFKGTTVVQGEITLDLPTFEPDYKGTLAWMRISVTVELTGNPYVATELFEGIQLVSPSGAFAPIVLVGPQSACGSNGIGRDCFPVGQNNHTFTLPDVTRFPSSADSLKSILGKNPPADGYFLRVLGPKGIKVPNWIVEVGFK